MMGWFVFLSDLAAAAVRIAVGLALAAGLLSAGRPGRRAAGAVLGGAAVSAAVSAAGGPDFCRIMLEAGWIAVCMRRLQGADIRMSLFISFFYEIAAAFWQFLFTAWMGVLLRWPALPERGTREGQLAIWLFHAVLIVSAAWLLRHREAAKRETARLASFPTVAGILLVVTLSEQTTLAIADDTLDMWTILAAVQMMAFQVFNMNRQYEAEKELVRLKSEQAELLERDYTALNNAYEVNAKLFHDVHNHIGVLRRLLVSGRTEEAVRYLDDLQAPVREMTDAVWTGDETVDFLINSKAAAARSAGIRLEAQVEFPRHTNLRSADLCMVLGNLLDNALEAAGQVREPERRFVRLVIRRINRMLVIKVENGFAVLPVTENGSLKTTKEKGGLHGWGLKSARTAAEKYDGMLQISYADQVFRAVVTLSYQGAGREA